MSTPEEVPAPRILFVDDDPSILAGFRRMLYRQSPTIDTHFASSVPEALEILAQHPFAAVISDVRMPGQDGFDLLRLIIENPETADTPVIMVTGGQETDLKQRALEQGALDLLTKPVEREDLLARIRNAIRAKGHLDQINAQNERLLRTVRELDESRFDIVWCLARAAEWRDGLTGKHVVRVAGFSRAIAEEMGMDREYVDVLSFAAPLHDVGKIGIPDVILHKKGKLTPEEWGIMRGHCQIGAEILSPDGSTAAMFRSWGANPAVAGDGSINPLLAMGARVALGHHERWDGAGYPAGLKGEAIPLEARIVPVADAFDALRSVRPYKLAVPEEEALARLRTDVGAHFDPDVFAAFERALPVIREIYERYRDEPAADAAAA